MIWKETHITHIAKSDKCIEFDNMTPIYHILSSLAKISENVVHC